MVDPSAFIFEHRVKWGSWPVSLFQNSQKCVEMDFLNECLFSFSWIWDFLTYCAVLDWPVEPSVFLHVMILSQINEFKLISQTFYLDRLSRLSSLKVHLINAFIQIFSVFTITSHTWLLLLLNIPNTSSIRAVNSSVLLSIVLFIFALLEFLNAWNDGAVVGRGSTVIAVVLWLGVIFLFTCTSWTRNTKSLFSSNGWWHHIVIRCRLVILNLDIKDLWIRYALWRMSDKENFILGAIRLFLFDLTSLHRWFVCRFRFDKLLSMFNFRSNFLIKWMSVLTSS